MLNDAQCPYYQSRSTEAALCKAFPVDEILIRGLRALQVHLQGKGFYINIPRLNVMNAAHRIAAYLFVSDHTAGQIELDAMVYGLARYDRYQALFIQMVLAAILKRTEGKRARMYRSIILDDRCEEFNEGVSLYEQFLEHTEKHFCEDDFLIDVAAMALTIRTQNEEIQRLNKQITTMENNEKSQTVINVAGNYIAQQNIDIHDNTNCNIYAAEPRHVAQPTTADCCISIPAEGKYTEVRRYIEERQLNDPDFKIFCETHSRVELCQRLTDEFGWVVDDHSLGRNINRNR